MLFHGNDKTGTRDSSLIYDLLCTRASTQPPEPRTALQSIKQRVGI
jgi:hypothetical protein